jgi:hypothetical protein
MSSRGGRFCYPLSALAFALYPGTGTRYPLAAGYLYFLDPIINTIGAGKQKVGDPRGEWVGRIARVQKRDRVGFVFVFPIFFARVFGLSSPRNAQKRDKKKSERKSVLDFWSNFL